jgi:hypothetical protein
MLERRHCQPAASDDAGSCDSRRKQRWLVALKKIGGLLYRAAQKRRAQKPRGHETVAAQPVHSSASFERVQRLAPVHEGALKSSLRQLTPATPVSPFGDRIQEPGLFLPRWDRNSGPARNFSLQ